MTDRRANDQPEVLRSFGLGEEDLAAWQQSGVNDSDFDDWLMDRVARRPRGPRARAVYGAEDVHDFARTAILGALALGPGDRLLEVGCGGGLLLRDALRSGASATGIDHSEDMVTLARERAVGADVLAASAEDLPFGDGEFSAVAMSIVFFFFDDPVLALREATGCWVVPGGWPCTQPRRSCAARRRPQSPLPASGISTRMKSLASSRGRRASNRSRCRTRAAGSC